jgi:hypothetical protein
MAELRGRRRPVGTLPNPTLVNIAGVAGTYGSSTKVPVITIDNKGRITAVSEVTIIGGGGGGGGALSPLTTKGDIWVYGTGDTRLGVGSNGQILTADSTAPNGIKWAAAPAAGVWGQITGLLSDQVDLANALAAKVNNTTYNALVASLSAAAFSGSYNDLLNKPSIPAAQVNSDWNALSGAAQILNKPTFATVATTGAYADLSGKPDLTLLMPKAGGTFTGAIVLAADPTANLQPATKQYVDKLGSTSLIRNEIPGGLINSSNTAYTTASTFSTGSLKVYLNGQRLNPGSGNDYVEGTQGFTMQYAPATGDILLVDYETTNTAFIQGSNSIVVQETPTGSVNGSNTAFTTQLGKYVANSLAVFINGIQQTKTTDYAETTPGSGIFTFTTAPFTGDILRISYQFSTGASGNADTVDGFHASTTPTAGNLLPLNSRGQSGEWYEELGRTTLSVAGDTISVQNIPAKKYLRILVLAIPTGGTGANGRLRFNNDSAANYAYATQDNGGAAASAVSQTFVDFIGTALWQTWLTMDIINMSAAEKFGTAHRNSRDPGAANAPFITQNNFKWANTSAQITRVDYYNDTGTGDFAVGSEVIVLGHD